MSAQLFRWLLLLFLLMGIVYIGGRINDVASAIRERNALPVYADEDTI